MRGKKLLQTLGKIAKTITICVIIFLGPILGEAFIRSMSRETQTIHLKQIPEAKVTLTTMPDFLWMGTSWWIETNSASPLILNLEPHQSAIIPKGSHTIHCNHDNSNLSNYGFEFNRAVLSQITISAIISDEQ